MNASQSTFNVQNSASPGVVQEPPSSCMRRGSIDTLNTFACHLDALVHPQICRFPRMPWAPLGIGPALLDASPNGAGSRECQYQSPSSRGDCSPKAPGASTKYVHRGAVCTTRRQTLWAPLRTCSLPQSSWEVDRGREGEGGEARRVALTCLFLGEKFGNV